MTWTTLAKALSLCLLVAPSAAAAQDRTVAKHLSDSYNRFGLQLFQQIQRSDFGANIFISPASAAIALAMLYNGAEGITAEEMTRTLELGALSLEDVNQANASLLSSLSGGEAKVELSVANSIWYRDTFKFRQDFLDRTRGHYAAEIASLNFDSPGAADIINDWVRESTRQRIDSIVDEINPLDVMFLVNAVYFKGMWTHPFDEALTEDLDFKRLDGSVKRTPLMQQTGRFEYTESESLQAIRLPYGTNRYRMLVILPAAEYGLKQFLLELTPEKWAELQTQLSRREGTIALPRFKLEYDRMLNDALIAMDMRSVFDETAANLGGLWDRGEGQAHNLYVSFVRQKSYLEVNEEGTEAAAVTGIGIRATSMAPPVTPPFTMIVDRPFFCAIEDSESGLILFLGGIVEPAS